MDSTSYILAGVVMGLLTGYVHLYFTLKNITMTGKTHGHEKILGEWYEIRKLD